MARAYTPIGWENGTKEAEAYVTISGVDYEVTPEQWDGNTPVDATNLDHMEKGIENSFDVKIIAYTDTEPSECSTGDVYYNTANKLLYKATGTNTWETTGSEPLEGILYILFDSENETGKSYSWDGSDLISVGGTNYTAGANIQISNTNVISATDTTYSNATTSTAGLMSSTDKTKLDDITVAELVNYKGHVSNESDLPSLGQSSGTIQSQNIIIASTYNDTALPLSGATLSPQLTYYLFEGRYQNSTSTGVLLETNYPEVIHTIVSYKVDNSTHEYYNGYLGWYIEKNPDKPVYITYEGNNYTRPYYYYTKTNDTWSASSRSDASISRRVINSNQNYIFHFVGYNSGDNAGNITYGNSDKLWIKSNIPKIDFKYIDLGLSNYSLTNSIKLNGSAYYYNSDMIFLTSDDATGQMYFQGAETDTKLGDTYTVGTDYQIYYRNSLPAWEKWSKSSGGGGGSSDIIIVEPDEPTEETKLLIEEEDLDFQGGTEITNNYSQSTTIGYSANYVNNLNTYSTDEIRIGTYLGKPLYRRVFNEYTLVSETAGTSAIYQFATDQTMNIKSRNLAVRLVYSTTHFFDAGLGDNGTLGSFRVAHNFDDGNIRVAREDYGTSYTIQSMELTLEYTKTTDN